MIDAAAVLAQLRATDARSGGRREAWTEPLLAGELLPSFAPPEG